METLEHRIRRYLLARLHRRAVLDLYEAAADAGLLAGCRVGDDDSVGQVWSVPRNVSQLLTGTPLRDRELVRRLIGCRGGRRVHDETVTLIVPDSEDDNGIGFDELIVSIPANERDQLKAGVQAPGSRDVSDIGFRYVADLLKAHLAASAPLHVAVSLLLARAIGTSLSRLSMLTDALRLPAPFVLIKAPVARFEASLGLMLEDNLLLPFPVVLEDATREGSLSGRYRQSPISARQRKIKTLAGSVVATSDDKTVRRQLREAIVSEQVPILAVDQMPQALTPVLTATADLVLECDGFDRAMIADLLHICIGASPERTLQQMEAMVFDPALLSIDDLVLAVRPGRSGDDVLTILAMLIERFSHEEGDDHEESTERDRQRRSGGERGKVRSSAKDAGKTRPENVGVEVIRPEPVTADPQSTDGSGAQTAKMGHAPVASVETLSGYGAARDWALDLKADLALWREGALDWSEMSTKLLLSGPPGTGKTTYAKALCNTLQVPLLVTSVANWLEPGYLGDVLQRMSGAFAHAKRQAPSILFIDEIDNIGTRLSDRERSYSDYWVSLVNRLLELLDGAAKSEGVVIVAATNLPEKIDPALLRSGRLETHVRIPIPDLETLGGILAHHLGRDLPAVLSSAPVNQSRHRLRSVIAGDHDPQQQRKTSERGKAGQQKGVSP